MKNALRPGEIRQHRMKVRPEDIAAFDGVVVHEVCSTFALAQHVEWTTRQFVLDMKDDDEEGVGTYLEIEHLNPAFVGDAVTIVGRLEYVKDNDIRCSFEASVGEHLVARGATGQKILKREKLKKYFNHG